MLRFLQLFYYFLNRSNRINCTPYIPMSNFRFAHFWTNERLDKHTFGQMNVWKQDQAFGNKTKRGTSYHKPPTEHDFTKSWQSHVCAVGFLATQ